MNEKNIMAKIATDRRGAQADEQGLTETPP